MSVFVTDTHPLVWFGSNKPGNLSKSALEAFASAESGNAFIHIPAMVLYEIAILEKLGKIVLAGGFRRWTEKVFKNAGFGVVNLELEMINTAVGYSFNSDPFDRVIVATAAELTLPLITKDTAISESGLIEICW